MGYTRRGLRGYLAGFGSPRVTGMTLAGDLTQESGQILLRTGDVNDLVIARSADTTDGLYIDENDLVWAVNNARQGRFGAGNSVADKGLLVLEEWRLFGESIKTGAYTMGAGDARIPCDTTGGALTISLIAGQSWQIVYIEDFGGNCGTNAVTVAGDTGVTVVGDTSLNVDHAEIKCKWDSTNSQWVCSLLS